MRTVTADQMELLATFSRRPSDDEKVLIHSRGGIGRSPACALGVYVARGLPMREAIGVVLQGRPGAEPNPLVVLTLDEVLNRNGQVWHDFHTWAYEQEWWHTRPKPDRSRTMSQTRQALEGQTHKKRPKQ